ncbi:phage tail fiber protein [uncultured Desulfovibrio sp.]|uniref:phage tail fiber domain-containing protein n=1 Tax=uncultured Desulfovibrio sp. TaxID=167968 RepID=UPI0026025AEF|nr:phage tail fiber protein [uncultured Desulfovibrio sp.]
MAYSRVTYTGDGSTTIFTVPFEYIKKSFVKVVVAEEPVASDAIEWLTNASIKLAVAPAAGSTVYIYRDTEKESPVTGYRDGSVLSGSDLDNQTRQLLHIAQETQDVADEQMRLDSHDLKYDAQGRVIKNVGDAVADTDAVNFRTWKQVIQPALDDALAQATVKANQAEASAVGANSSALLASGQATISGQHARESEVSAVASAQSAAEARIAAEAAKETLPENWIPRVQSLEAFSVTEKVRMDAVEAKDIQQDTRLNGVEGGITALSATLIGSIQTMLCADSYVPNGAVPANGGEYTREQFREFYDTYLAGGKLLTCTYAAFAAQVALTGNCARFALDTTAQKFKVPLLKDGDSITQAASAAELGKSVKAGLPNITGSTLGFQAITGAYGAGALYSTGSGGIGFGQTSGGGWNSIGLDANRSNPTYRNDVSTVITEQVRLRHFVVLASTQNSASVFDWSNYMAGLAGKANVDLSNIDGAARSVIKNVAKPISGLASRSTTGAWAIAGVVPWIPIKIYLQAVDSANGTSTICTYGGNSSGLAITHVDTVLGNSGGINRSSEMELLPNATTVTIYVSALNGVLYAEQ